MAVPNADAPNDPWCTRSSRLHNTLFALFIGSVLAYGAGFAWYTLVRFDLVNLIRDVNHDDSFYYFQIASNLAAGKFSTFDGGITRTNGYHPLWMLLITPFYWIFDKETALFGIKAFEIMLIAAGIALVAGAAWLARLPWILLFALPPLLYGNVSLFMGMEAAVALFMLGLFFLNQCLYAGNPARWKWLLAAMAFALPWVRLEYVALSLATAAALCLIEWSRQKWSSTASWKESVRSISALPAVASLCGACAGILLYFVYNGLVFGGIVPVSGAVKHAYSQFDWERRGGYSLMQNFLDTLRIPVFDDEMLVAMEVCAYLLLVWWFARHSRSRQDRLLLTFLVCVFGLAAGHLAKFAQNVLTMTPTWGTYGWYFVPMYLMMALIVPVRYYVATYFIRRFIEPLSSRAAHLLNLGSVLSCAVFLLMEADLTKPFQYVSSASENLYQEWEIDSYKGVQIMNRILPARNVIGSWDSGVIGYFSRVPVVNLDGLANSYDYFETMNADRKKYFLKKDEFKPIHQEFGITYLANAGGVPLRNTVYESASFSATASYQQNFKLASADPWEDVDPTAWFWKRIAPHFDFRVGNIGVVVDGRLAQMFARDCTPDEKVVWVSGEREDIRLFQPWTHTEMGLCTAAFVLPRNALPPFQFQTILDRDRKPALRSNFDVSLTGNSILYEKRPCLEDDTDTRFFLNLFPVDVNDLPDHRRQYKFENLDFDFDRYGSIAGGICRAKVPLPDYDIAHIRTGQQVPGADPIWEGSFDVTERMHDRYSTADPSSNQWRFGSFLSLVGEQFIGQFEDRLDGWLLEGEAVTNQIWHEQSQGQAPISGSEGRGFLTSYHPGTGDAATGQARSPVFIPESDHYLVFLIAGGGGPGVGLRLWADGKENQVWRGEFTEDFKLIVHSLVEVAGRRLHLEMFDDETGGWGHIMLDHVMLVRRNVDDLQ